MRSWTLPLPALGSLGALGKDATMYKIYEDTLPSKDGSFKISRAQENGHKWKTKVERYLISKVPMLKPLLHWAETQDLSAHALDHISEPLLARAVGGHVTREQLETLRAAVTDIMAGIASAEEAVVDFSMKTRDTE